MRTRFRPGRSGFTLFELLIVIVIIGIVYGLFIQNLDVALNPPEERAKFSELKSTLKTFQDKDIVSLVCTEGCRTCVIHKDGEPTESTIGLNPPIRAYALNRNGLMTQINFGEIFLDDDYVDVCFRFDVHPNGAGSSMVVEYGQKFYVFHPYFQDTTEYASLSEAQEELMEVRKILRD